MYATAQISLRATNIIIEQFSRVLGLGVNPEMVSITAANEGLASGSQQGHAAPRNTNSSGDISSESRFENALRTINPVNAIHGIDCRGYFHGENAII